MVGIKLDSGMRLTLPECVNLLNESVDHKDRAMCSEIIEKLEIQGYNECAQSCKQLVRPMLSPRSTRRMSKAERRDMKKAAVYYKDPMKGQMILHPDAGEGVARERLPSIDLVIRRNSIQAALEESQETKKVEKEPAAPVGRLHRAMSQEARWFDGELFREQQIA